MFTRGGWPPTNRVLDIACYYRSAAGRREVRDPDAGSHDGHDLLPTERTALDGTRNRLALAVADANWFTTENLFREVQRDGRRDAAAQVHGLSQRLAARAAAPGPGAGR